ncbi:MAG: hypothetical protein Q9217_003521 [Psora testacea]
MSTINTSISSPPSSIQLDKDASTKPPYVNVNFQSNSIHQQSPIPGQANRPALHHKSSLTTEAYFTGPADIERHSKLPYFLRMHGSITPRMLVPLSFVAIWATIITCISNFWYPLVVNSLLLTVLGFVVGLGISFRTSSAYERYVEGRRYWAQLSQSSRDLARHIWIHAEERHDVDPETGKADLLAKISALNLIVAFAIALKHKLRFEPYTNHPDLGPLVSHLSTFAGNALHQAPPPESKTNSWKRRGTFLGLSFAESNPRKLLKRANAANLNLGNLPLEILTYLSAYTTSIVANRTLDNGVPQAMILGNLGAMNEVLAGAERVLNTPLPVAYSIAISQITWVYVLVLPFQLWASLRWITIPGTIVGAYIILGIAAIGREIENPFGHDVNDLPLEKFCAGLADEISVIASRPRPAKGDWLEREENRVLFGKSWNSWSNASVEDIREALAAKAAKAGGMEGFEARHERLCEKVMRHAPV